VSPLIPPNRIIAFPLKDDLQWYDPEVVFSPFDDIFGRGVVGSGDLMVIPNGTPDGQVSVQAGHGYVPYQSGGKRFFKLPVTIRSDAAEFQRSVGAYTGTPRVDRVIAKVLDATMNPPDSLKGGVFDVLPGTPTAGATLANLSGAASVPSSALLLGNILSSGATIPGSNIDSTFGTVRARARIGGGNSPTKTVSVNGAALTDRTALNLIAGANIGISGADNPGADSTDVTITNTMPPPVMPMVKLFDFQPTATESDIDTYADGGNVLLPQTYSTLVIRGRVQSTAAASDAALNVNFNNDSTANYDWLCLAADSITGPAVTNGNGQTSYNCMRINAGSSSNAWAMFEMVIVDYANTTGRMEVILSGTDSGVSGSRRWSTSCTYHGNTISRIKFAPGSGSFAAGSRVIVWGIV